MIAIGTCGFSYSDWIGPVYPRGTKPADMLAEYARRFAVVEIDSTYYGVPKESAFESMARRTPDDFRFTAKLPGTGTHIPDSGSRKVHDDVHSFCRNLQPLIDAGKFACALMQFPNSFRPSDATRAYIAELKDVLAAIPLVAEFRNREWQTNETLELLRNLHIGIVNVDQPQFDSLLRPSSDTTSGIAYVRFHGRNYKEWWNGTNVTRYDYLYTAEELGPWADRLVDLAANPDVKEVLGFFNNHRRGQAVQNAEMFETILESRFPAGTVVRALPSPSAEPEPQALELDL
ncbi:MAG: DUF72 domain-containing protein [Candidatus Velthaea sp.]